MGIKPKPNGGYLLDIRDELGDRHEKTFRTKLEARSYEAKITAAKYQNSLIKNKLIQERYSIYNALEDYRISKSDLRPKSIQKYNSVIKELKFFIDDWAIQFIDEFTPDMASQFYNELVKEKLDPKSKKKKIVKAKPKTVNFALTATRAFFEQEVMKQHIKFNPMRHIKNQRVEKRKPEYYTEAEIKRFFAQKMHPNYHLAFIGLFFTGMRISELANLRWENVDFHNKLFIVQSNENYKTKTNNSERNIPIVENLLKILLNIYKNPPSKIYPFCSPMGKQLRERSLLHICKKVAKSAKITSNSYLHKFRHTYATMLIQNGTPIQDIKELLGHWSVVQTEVYAHNKSDHLHSQVAKLNKLIQ